MGDFKDINQFIHGNRKYTIKIKHHLHLVTFPCLCKFSLHKLHDHQNR